MFFRYVPPDRYRALRSEQDVNTIDPDRVAAGIFAGLDEEAP